MKIYVVKVQHSPCAGLNGGSYSKSLMTRQFEFDLINLIQSYASQVKNRCFTNDGLTLKKGIETSIKPFKLRQQRFSVHSYYKLGIFSPLVQKKR